jgi:histidinol phosphatase-like PHP family hydrolase
MDALDAFVGSLHQMLGHDRTAAYLGQPAGDRAGCALCHPELVGATVAPEAMREIAARRKGMTETERRTLNRIYSDIVGHVTRQAAIERRPEREAADQRRAYWRARDRAAWARAQEGSTS